MCGIIGYIGERPCAQEVVLNGLRILEYRGYDSAGFSTLTADDRIVTERRADYRHSVEALLDLTTQPSRVGIGHTRWATHGTVAERNAHPLSDPSGRLAFVHNGTVENHEILRTTLADGGYEFQSTTDTETALGLVARKVAAGASPLSAMADLALELKGASCFLLLDKEHPNQLICAKFGNAGGLVIGVTKDASYVASDTLALSDYCDQVRHLNNGQLAVVVSGQATYYDRNLKRVELPAIKVTKKDISNAKGKYDHFMAKEIADQPQVLRSACYGRIRPQQGVVELAELDKLADRLPNIGDITLVGMGTSLHAAELAAAQIERLARVAAKAVNAAEFRYGNPVVGERTLVVAVTQSGETADTLAAIEQAKKCGAAVLAVVENGGTQATRLADDTLLINAGFEQAVAATKTFLATAVTLLQLTLFLAQKRGALSAADLKAAVDAVQKLPLFAEQTLALNPQIADLVGYFDGVARSIYFARGDLYPIAREGALKMKEVAYIHAEAVAGGEMKHGINALIDDQTPGVALIGAGELELKTRTNISEYEARGGRVIRVAAEGAAAELHFMRSNRLIEPLLAAIPLQQLAYHTAVARGNDPDRPRNLAKTVTVE